MLTAETLLKIVNVMGCRTMRTCLPDPPEDESGGWSTTRNRVEFGERYNIPCPPADDQADSTVVYTLLAWAYLCQCGRYLTNEMPYTWKYFTAD
jgi:hypothetical protein